MHNSIAANSNEYCTWCLAKMMNGSYSLQENNNGKYKKNYKSCNFNYNTACLEVMENNPYVYVL